MTALLSYRNQLAGPFSKLAPQPSKATLSHDVENEILALSISAKRLAFFFTILSGTPSTPRYIINKIKTPPMIGPIPANNTKPKLMTIKALLLPFIAMLLTPPAT